MVITTKKTTKKRLFFLCFLTYCFFYSLYSFAQQAPNYHTVNTDHQYSAAQHNNPPYPPIYHNNRNETLKEGHPAGFKEGKFFFTEDDSILDFFVKGIKNPRNILSLDELGKRALRTMHLDAKSLKRDQERYNKDLELKNAKRNRSENYFYP